STNLVFGNDITSFFVIKFDDFYDIRPILTRATADGTSSIDYYLRPAIVPDFYTPIDYNWPGWAQPLFFRGSGTPSDPRLNGAPRYNLPPGRFQVLAFESTLMVVNHFVRSKGLYQARIQTPVVNLDGPLRIGAAHDFKAGLKGEIAELLIYQRTL